MDKEYEQMKEARIALLCVGDIVYRVYAGKAYSYKETSNLIAICKVTKIISRTSIVITRSYVGSGTCENPESIDLLEGELYVWNHGSHFHDCPPEERIAVLMDIFKKGNVRYEYFSG
jgi:hypothetical protein